MIFVLLRVLKGLRKILQPIAANISERPHRTSSAGASTIILEPKIPPTAPPTSNNGTLERSTKPLHRYTTAPAAAEGINVANVVPIIALKSKSGNVMVKSGVIIAPPDIPKRPLKKPATSPPDIHKGFGSSICNEDFSCGRITGRGEIARRVTPRILRRMFVGRDGAKKAPSGAAIAAVVPTIRAGVKGIKLELER